MAAAEVFPDHYRLSFPSTAPEIYGGTIVAPEVREAHVLMDRYFDLRERAAAEPVPDDATVEAIQNEVDADVNLNLRERLSPENLRESYGRYDPATVARFRDVIAYLQARHGNTIPQSVFEASEAFLQMAVGMFESTPEGNESLPGGDGSFVFLVPPRTDRKHPEYSRETIEACPILRYLPQDLRIGMYVGMPPFVVDRYTVDEFGRRGYMVLVPAFGDQQEDIGDRNEAAIRSWISANDAVRIGHNLLGADTFGLGAVLPAVLRYGWAIENKDIVTTSGHGGTIALMIETVRSLIEREAVDKDITKKIGIIGLGAIGEAIARIFAELNPDAEIRIYDKVERKMRETVAAIATRDAELGNTKRGGIIRTASAQELIEGSSLILSAATSKVDLSGIKTLEGKVWVDDSQPSTGDAALIELLGGYMLWPIGENPAGNIIRRESGWNYGGTLLPLGLFGCESEVAYLAWLYAMKQRDPIIGGARNSDTGRPAALDFVRDEALDRPVTVADALRYLEYFRQAGIIAARTPQAEGRPTVFPHMKPVTELAPNVTPISRNRRWRWSQPIRALLHTAGVL